jgi:hypothetical protein
VNFTGTAAGAAGAAALGADWTIAGWTGAAAVAGAATTPSCVPSGAPRAVRSSGRDPTGTYDQHQGAGETTRRVREWDCPLAVVTAGLSTA